MIRRFFAQSKRTGRSGVIACVLVFWIALSSGAFAGRDSDIRVSDLPQEAQQTLRQIEQGGPFPYRRDGIIFGNIERRLPLQRHGYYREYTVPTKGLSFRGARRIVSGAGGERYYTNDHYRTFKRILP